MTALSSTEADVLDMVNSHGGLHVDAAGPHAAVARKLDARGLVTYSRTDGLVTRKTEETSCS